MGKKDQTQDDSSVPEAETELIGEETQRTKIERLLDEGYTPLQIEKEWGFPHSTVRDAAKKRILPENNLVKTDNGFPKMPLILKAGGGQEVISPEAILQGYLLSDGDAGALMLKGFMLYRAAQLAVMSDVEIMKGQAEAQAKSLKPILDVMDQARRDMDAAAQRARESNVEIATKAAAEVGGQAVDWMEQKFNQIQSQKTEAAKKPNEMEEMMNRMMGMMMKQVMGQMTGMPDTDTPVLVDKRNQGG